MSQEALGSMGLTDLSQPHVSSPPPVIKAFAGLTF